MKVIFPHRYRGPLTSANGGYAAGRLASFVDAKDVEVTLRLPPPLDRPLDVRRANGSTLLVDGDEVVAEAMPTMLDLQPPLPVRAADAERARERDVRGSNADFNECFVCARMATGWGSASASSPDVNHSTPLPGSRPSRPRSWCGPQSIALVRTRSGPKDAEGPFSAA